MGLNIARPKGTTKDAIRFLERKALISPDEPTQDGNPFDTVIARGVEAPGRDRIVGHLEAWAKQFEERNLA